jgi:hypothetical protein
MYTRFIIHKYASTGDGTWSVTPEVMTSFYDVQVTQSIEENKDSFSFKVNNNRNAFNREFKPMDQINVYYSINGAPASEDNLIIVGLVKKISLENSGSRKAFRVEGVGFSDVMTQALSFYNPGTETQNVMQYLKSCLETISLRNGNFNVTWNAQNPTIKSDNITSFPVFTQDSARVRDYNKSMSKILNMYLIDKFTGDGSYFWYVNNARELVIRKRYTTSVDLTVNSPRDFESVKTRINGDDVKNYVIVKCGLDLNNNPISAYFDDVVSRAKHGFRYHMLVDMNISKNIKLANPGISNSDLIDRVKDEGRAWAEDFVKIHAKGFLVVQGQMKPRLDISVANNVQVNITSYADFNVVTGNIRNKLMRVQSIQYDLHGLLVELKEEAQT